MKLLRAALVACSCALPLVCMAQWMWVDKDGRKVLSDQAPPADIPAKNILRQPGRRMEAPVAATPAASAASEPGKPVLVAKPGKETELEAKKKAADAAEAEKVAAKEQEVQKARADNCERAKRAKASFDSGARQARVNAKGEREIMDDASRAVEAKRIEGIVKSDCAPAG